MTRGHLDLCKAVSGERLENGLVFLAAPRRLRTHPLIMTIMMTMTMIITLVMKDYDFDDFDDDDNIHLNYRQGQLVARVR